MQEFDYIVVGAGSAGCVVADRLSADPRRSVLLIEAGGSDFRFWIKTPIGYGKSFFDPAVNWRFESLPDPGLGDRVVYVPRGKVLGGSSSINAMVYARGLPGDFDDWRDAGNPGWGWSDVEPVFRSFERRVAGDGSARGDGPLWVSDREAEYHPLKRHYLAAAREAGLPIVSDLGLTEAEGVGPYLINTRKGLRCSAADAFLRPAMKRPNLTVATGLIVDRIGFEGRRARTVECLIGGERRSYRARAEIVLSAGAVGSPAILQRSGVGPGALLADLGVPIVHDAPGVGGHLQDHLGINYYYRATEPTLNAVLGTWPGRIAAGIRFLATRTGALSLSVNQMGGLVRSSPELARPDMQLYFNPLSYSTEIAGQRKLSKPDPWPGFILSFNACRPTSTGRIDIAGADPLAQPRIRPNYLSTDRDLADVLAGARLVARLQETRAMKALAAAITLFDPARASDEAIVEDFRKRSGSVFHLCGTCRMAPQAADGVVGPDLKVHGVEGLRVADTSIFPNVTSANTNAPAIMVGHKAAAMIAAG